MMMDLDDHANLLPKLGAAIDAALAAWETYLQSLTEHHTYESILSSNISDVAKKALALRHLLETLPSRHTALVASFWDDSITPIELSDQCSFLLSELQEPESDVQLEGWFKNTVTNKRFIINAMELEKEITEGELERLQNLKRLKGVQLALMQVREDGELGTLEVKALVDAMEEVGVDLITKFDEVERKSNEEEREEEASASI